MEPVREYASRKLRELRMERGLTTTEVADKIGVAQSTISRMESNRQRLDGVLLMRICRLYHVSADVILGTYNDDVEEVPTELATVSA